MLAKLGKVRVLAELAGFIYQARNTFLHDGSDLEEKKKIFILSKLSKKYDGAIRLPIYGFLLIFNSKTGPK